MFLPIIMKKIEPKKIAKKTKKGAKSFAREFKEFLKKYNVLAMAIAFVMGLAAKDLVSAIVDDVIMPLINLISPNANWSSMVFKVGEVSFLVGHLVRTLIDFSIIALIIFFIVKSLKKSDI